MTDFKYNIVQSLGVVCEKDGSPLEVNLISYNDRPPVIDIRVWHNNHKRFGKGITIPIDCVGSVIDKLKQIQEGEY